MTATTGNLLRDVPVHASAEIFADLMAWQAAG
ncbi:MAG TPA: cupin, partial [Cupriavidus sp.]|nr:cupin [Cupriavidus sp.]